MWISKIVTNNINRHEFSYFSRLHVFSIGLTLAYILSLYNSIDIMVSMFEIFYQFQMLILYFYIIHYITDEKRLTYIVRVLLVCLFAQSVLIFIQFLTQTQFNLTGQADTLGRHIYDGHIQMLRPGGTADSPAAAAEYLTALLFIALGFFFSRQGRVERLLVGVTLALGGGALILTHTRAAWASFVVAFVVFLSLGWRHKWVSVKGIAASLVLSILIMLPFSVRLFFRLTASDEGAGFARVHLAQLAWNMIQDHWITGVGINNFGLVIQDYLSPDLRGKWIYLVHNKYLLVFAETGIVGLIFFLLILLEIAYLCVRCMQSDNRLIALVALGILSGLLCHSAHMMVDIFNSRLAVELFWTIAALAVVTEKLFIRQVRQNASSFALPTRVAR
jgi:O-antigen ligase